MSESPRGGVPVHPGAEDVTQDRTVVAVVDGPVDCSSDGWGQRDQDDLAALAMYLKDAVTVFFAQVTDVRAGRHEDP